MILKKTAGLVDFFYKNRFPIIFITAASLLVSYFHYHTPKYLSAVHIAHYYAYYLIVIYAAFKFGLTGGLAVAAIMTLIYSPSSYTDIFSSIQCGNHTASYVEISMIYAVGAVSGYLSQQLKNEKIKVEKVSGEMLNIERKMAHDDRLRVLGQLSAGIAHEIRNPLAAIKTGISLIKSGKNNQQITDILESEILRLDSFVDRFLQYAKFGNNSPEYFSVMDFMTEIYELAALSVRGTNVSVQYEINTDSNIYGDKNSIKQAMLNLIINAIEASADSEKPSVTIKAENDDYCVVFSVYDSGKGITGDKDKIFEPFYTTKDNGTGLGLAIAMKIAEMHGGTITCETSENGTVFKMSVIGN